MGRYIHIYKTVIIILYFSFQVIKYYDDQKLRKQEFIIRWVSLQSKVILLINTLFILLPWRIYKKNLNDFFASP